MSTSAKLMNFGKAWLVKLGDILRLASNEDEMCAMLNRECPYPKGDSRYWVSENVGCSICDQEFIDIRPRSAVEIECPNCGYIEQIN